MNKEQEDELIECVARNSKNIEKLIECSSNNAHQLAELTDSVKTLSENTGDLVAFYRDIQGVARIGKIARNFIIWVASIPLIGGLLMASPVFERIVKYLTNEVSP